MCSSGDKHTRKEDHTKATRAGRLWHNKKGGGAVVRDPAWLSYYGFDFIQKARLVNSQ